MRVEWLFLRWLVIIGAIVAGVVYATSHYRGEEGVHYQVVPLVQGEKALGLPLAGVVVNPLNRQVYAIVGGAAAHPANGPDFFIAWSTSEGQTFSANFAADNGGCSLCRLGPEGSLLSHEALTAAGSKASSASLDRESLQVILHALPHRHPAEPAEGRP